MVPYLPWPLDVPSKPGPAPPAPAMLPPPWSVLDWVWSPVPPLHPMKMRAAVPIAEIPAKTFFILHRSLGAALLSRRADSGLGVGSNRSGGLLAERIVKVDTLAVGDAGAAENIEGGADGEVDAIAAEVGDRLEVFERTRSAGIGGGDAGPTGEFFDEFLVDAVAEAFDIDGMDEELVAMIGELGERFGAESDVGELLPTVRDDEVFAVAFAAA